MDPTLSKSTSPETHIFHKPSGFLGRGSATHHCPGLLELPQVPGRRDGPVNLGKAWSNTQEFNRIDHGGTIVIPKKYLQSLLDTFGDIRKMCFFAD